MPEEKSVFQKIADAVGTYAPAVSAALALTGIGAPAAGAVAALGALAKSFGLPTTAQPEEVLSKVISDPELKIKAMAAENDFALQMRKADLEEIKAVLGDVQSARIRDTEIKKSGQKNIRADVLLLLAFGTVVVIYGLIAYFGELTLGSLIVGSMLTTVGTFVQKIGTVYDFEFGSSRGSVQKTENANETAKELAKLVEKK